MNYVARAYLASQVSIVLAARELEPTLLVAHSADVSRAELAKSTS